MDGQQTAFLDDEEARAGLAADEFDRDWLRSHLADERRKASMLGEIREAIFGAQDGLVSTLAAVTIVAGASSDQFAVLVAGIAVGLGGIFSMAAGEYMSSKSQHEIFEAQIVGERQEVAERPGEAEAEMAYMFEEDGLPARGLRHPCPGRRTPPRSAAQDDGREGAWADPSAGGGQPDAGRPDHGRRLRPWRGGAGRAVPDAGRRRDLGLGIGHRRSAVRRSGW